MFVGHYSVSFVAKRIAPEVPLWILFVAAQIVDIFWAIFIATGIEQVRIVPGFTASNPLDLHFMPFTHSLPASLLWAIGLAAITAALLPSCRNRRAMLVVAVVVMSHWLLDLLVHVPDLPLWGNEHKVGFGLWNHFAVALLLETALLLAGAFWLCADSNQAKHRKRLIILTAVLLLVHAGNLIGPPPQSVTHLAISAFAAYVIFGLWAWFAQRSN
jgi:hypothetical protein